MRIRRSILRSQTPVPASCTQSALYCPDPYPTINKKLCRNNNTSRKDTSLRVQRIKRVVADELWKHHWTPAWVMAENKRPHRYRTAYSNERQYLFQAWKPKLNKLAKKALGDYQVTNSSHITDSDYCTNSLAPMARSLLTTK